MLELACILIPARVFVLCSLNRIKQAIFNIQCFFSQRVTLLNDEFFQVVSFQKAFVYITEHSLVFESN